MFFLCLFRWSHALLFDTLLIWCILLIDFQMLKHCWLFHLQPLFPPLTFLRYGVLGHGTQPFFYLAGFSLPVYCSFGVRRLSFQCGGGGVSPNTYKQFNSILTQSTQRWHQASQVKGSVLQDLLLPTLQMPVKAQAVTWASSDQLRRLGRGS